ncbi:hypothetical protein GVAV_002683 [Gurleya vavrai]
MHSKIFSIFIILLISLLLSNWYICSSQEQKNSNNQTTDLYSFTNLRNNIDDTKVISKKLNPENKFKNDNQIDLITVLASTKTSTNKKFEKDFGNLQKNHNLNLFLINSKLSFSTEKTVFENNHQVNILRNKRGFYAFENKKIFRNSSEETLIYSKNGYEEYLKNSKKCRSETISLFDMQLLNFGSFQNPKVYFVYFDESQYIESNMVKITNRLEYFNIYLSLLLFEPKKLNYVIDFFNAVDSLKILEINHLCNIRQLYINKKMFLIIYKDGESFWLGKHSFTDDEKNFQTEFYDQYMKDMINCEYKHFLKFTGSLCCKNYAFAISLNKIFPNLFLEASVKNFFELCIQTKYAEKLSRSLRYRFEPKSIET